LHQQQQLAAWERPGLVSRRSPAAAGRVREADLLVPALSLSLVRACVQHRGKKKKTGN